MSEIIRDLADQTKPLCPNSISEPVHEAHRLRVRVLDAFYDAAEKNADDEMPEPLETAYNAAAYGSRVPDRMDLYRHIASFYQGVNVVVESYWFRCHVCGFVLPAQRRES